MIMPSRIKITHFTQQFKSLLRNFLGKSLASNIFACNPISLHDITLAFFDDQIWINKWKNIIKHFTGSLPIIYRPGESKIAGISISRVFRSAKCFFQPYNKGFIATSYFKHTMPLITVAILPLFNPSQIEATFAVNNSGKICDLGNIMISLKMYNFSHDYPYVYNNYIINEQKIHGERLSEETSKEDAIV